MIYGQDTISEVKALNDIVDVVGGYVKLSPRAGNHFGICPFHNEKTPSFSVNRDKQIFYCFGCGAGGNVISFIKRIENMDFPDALKLLAERVHFNLPQKGTSKQAKIQAAARELSADLNKKAARFYYDNLYEETSDAIEARKYLENRGINPAIMRKFGIGLSPDSWDGLIKNFAEISVTDLETAGLVKKSNNNEKAFYDRFRNRLMFPIIDLRARVIGFGGRILSDSSKEAKYINSPETALFKKSECLYGLNLAKKVRSPEIIIVEGYMDVITMHLHGFKNTVGVLGTAMRNTHARLLKNAGASTAILILDSDEAGIRAAQRAIPVLIKEGLKVKIFELEDAKDPDEYLAKNDANKLKILLSSAQSHIAFQVGIVRKQHDLGTTEGRVGFTQESAKILAKIPSAIEIDAYTTEIAKASEISPAAIQKEIAKISGDSNEFSYIPRTFIPRKRGEDIGLKNAKKELLNLLFTQPKAVNALKKSEILSSEEMGSGIYGKLLEIAMEKAVNSPSDVFDLFETDEEHHNIAEIFATIKEYPSDTAITKALCDMVKKIKLSWLNMRIEIEKDDLNAVNSLLSRIKTTNLLNISLHDG
ncbi:MAG: DNA primase [Defluviitaleaceae bacterium]|nr:DNA primase [Defluviitaleaceae bacterium]